MHKLLAIFFMVACCGKQVYLQAAGSNDSAIVYPTNYKLSLTTYLDENPEKKFTFEGSVVITIKVEHPVRHITLDAKKLIVHRSSLQAQNGTVVANYELQTGDYGSFNVTMTNDKFLGSGLYYLAIDYTGTIDQQRKEGLYSSWYEDQNENRVSFLATNFQPGYARSVFPCFEDPRYNATFELTIKNDKNYTALSNMQVKDKSSDNKTRTTVFEMTPAVPVQLLAIVVSKLKSIDNEAKNFTVHVPEHLSPYARLAFDEGMEILKKYKGLADINLNSSKIDIVYVPPAVPTIKSFNFMLIGGRHTTFDKERQTTSQKHLITQTLAYDLATEWFGHSFSVNPLNDVWNLRNIADFLSYYVIDQVEPSWHLLNRFIVNEEQSIDFSDSQLSIVLYKGEAALHMMEYVLTEPVFFKGLRNYLNKAYSRIVDSDDFFASMQEVANAENFKFNLTQVFESWMNLDSYPVLTVTRDYNAKTANLEQNSYKNGVKNNSVRYIPINYISSKKLTGESTKQINWLTESSELISIDVDSDDWILIDNQGVGYYRVNYDKHNWKLITQYLKSANREKIPALKRAQLLSDALVFTQGKLLDLDVLLTLTSYLEKETDYVAWLSGLNTLQWLGSKLIDTDYYRIYKVYVSAITSCALKSVGIDESEQDNDIAKIFRSSLIDFLCSIGDTYCIDKMHESLLKWLQDPSKNAISADMKSNVLCYGLKNADIATWNKAVKVDKTFTAADALKCSANKDILIKYFNDTADTKLDANEKISIITLYASKTENVNIELILELATVLKSLPDQYAASITSSIIRSLSKKFTEASQLETVKKGKLVSPMKSSYYTNIKQAIEQNTAWSRENGQNFVNTIATVSATLFAYTNECKL